MIALSIGISVAGIVAFFLLGGKLVPFLALAIANALALFVMSRRPGTAKVFGTGPVAT